MDLHLLKKRAYTPYSSHPDIAIVESKSGNLYPGVRVENISFPLTISAAQAAVMICLSEMEEPQTLFVENIDNANLDYWENEYSLTLRRLDFAETHHFKTVTFSSDVDRTLSQLLEKAITIHSDFPVSAVLETNEGLVSGVNIEENAWESGLCAERVAIAKALTYGITDIDTLHIHTRHGEYSSPCGACRQVIIEHMPRHPVCIHHPDGTVSRHFSSDLLPYSFKSDFLKKKSHS